MDEYPASFCVFRYCFYCVWDSLCLLKLRAVSEGTGSIGWEWTWTEPARRMPRIRDATRSTSWPHPLTIRGIYRLVPLPCISDFEEWVFWILGNWSLAFVGENVYARGLWRWMLHIKSWPVPRFNYDMEKIDSRGIMGCVVFILKVEGGKIKWKLKLTIKIKIKK